MNHHDPSKGGGTASAFYTRRSATTPIGPTLCATVDPCEPYILLSLSLCACLSWVLVHAQVPVQMCEVHVEVHVQCIRY